MLSVKLYKNTKSEKRSIIPVEITSCHHHHTRSVAGPVQHTVF